MEPLDEEPWLPFCSREDFEFAEIVHDAAMNRQQIDNLIKFVHRCQQDPGKFTLENFHDLKKSWENSSALLTDVSVSYVHHMVILTPHSSSHVTRSSSCIMVSIVFLKRGHGHYGGGLWTTS